MSGARLTINADEWLTFISKYGTEAAGEMLKAQLSYFLNGKTTAFNDTGKQMFYKRLTAAPEERLPAGQSDERFERLRQSALLKIESYMRAQGQ